MAEFFHMGGYASYVWSAYGLVLVVMLANFVVPIQRMRQVRRDLARRARLEGRAS